MSDAKIKTAFFDMDGVLADFVRGAFKLHNRSIPYDEVLWDFNEQMGLDAEEFFSPMGREFWASLDKIQEGFDLLRGCERLYGKENIAILTSPCKTDGCIEGKRDWVAKYLPEYQGRFFTGKAKHLFASPSKLLIDDRPENCEAFKEAGGQVYCFPQPWNAEYRKTISSISVNPL